MRRKVVAAVWAGIMLVAWVSVTGVALWAYARGLAEDGRVSGGAAWLRTSNPGPAEPALSHRVRAGAVQTSPAAGAQPGQRLPAPTGLPAVPQPPSAPEPAHPRTGLPGPPPARQPRLAIVIDDWGDPRPEAAGFLNLPYPLTMSVLPGLPESAFQARLGQAHGWQVILHIPMQPADGRPMGGAGVTLASSVTQIAALLDAAQKEIPMAVGANNHMGSLATANRAVMERFFSVFAGRGLFFLDSRTTPFSVAADTAWRYGVPCAINQGFLDSQPGVATVERRLQELAASARRWGVAVGIGHLRPDTLQALQSTLPRLAAEGIRLVPLSQVAADSAAWTRYRAWLHTLRHAASPLLSRAPGAGE